MRISVLHFSALLVLFCNPTTMHHWVCAQENVAASRLPLLRIDTYGQTIPDDHRTPAWMEILLRDGAQETKRTAIDYEGPVAIKIRGNSTRYWPKKQYGFEIRDGEGEDADASLLGLPDEEDWILNAPYADRSALRNTLIYTLAREMGHYAPRFRYCEVEVNGLPQGLYVLLEKIKRDKHRLALPKLTPADSAGDAVTGGYIFKIDHLDPDDEFFISEEAPHTPFVYIYVYPRADRITDAQRHYIHTYVHAFEQCMHSPEATHPERGYARYIDIPSFVDFLLLNELTNNIDGYIGSTFLHKDRDSNGGKLAMGPVWDFNFALGNAHLNGARYAHGWRIHRNHVSSWWHVLLGDSAFVDRLVTRWRTLRQSLLSETRLTGWIDSVTASIRPALERNHALWQSFDTYIYPDAWQSRTVDEEKEFLKAWLRDRLRWMDAQLPSIASRRASGETSALHTLDEVWPQPASDAITLRYTLGMYGNISFTITDMLGRTRIRINAGIQNIDRHSARIALDGLTSGVYQLRLHVGGRIVDARSIIVRK